MRDALLQGIRGELSGTGAVRQALSADGTPLSKLMIEASTLAGMNLSVSDYLCGVALGREMAAAYSDMDLAERSTASGIVSRTSPGTWRTLSVWEWAKENWADLSAVEALSYVKNEIDHRSKRYEVMQQAPKFYGFVLMILLAGFPVAGLYAVLPGGWRALANWAKLLVSVKLWPLFWNLLYLYTNLSADFDARLVLPAVYFMIPAVSFMFVQLSASAAGSAFTKIPEPPAVDVVGAASRAVPK